MDLCEKDWYVMKMDVKSFFMGIRKSLLSKRLDDFIISRYTNQRKLDTLRSPGSFNITQGLPRFKGKLGCGAATEDGAQACKKQASWQKTRTLPLG